jgi:tRNA uridine 5-carboxymethylaminomethyl modification enzyme
LSLNIIGTFLSGMILLGTKRFEMGRFGDRTTSDLSKTLAKFGFPVGRLKTGTPPRVDSNTIDFSALEIQLPDPVPYPFSFLNPRVKIAPNEQLPCHITYTNSEVHKIIAESEHLSAYSSENSATPQPGSPRYCPSIEIKIKRFAHRHRHQVDTSRFCSSLLKLPLSNKLMRGHN